LKKHLTSIILLVVLAAFMVCGYFVSPIFVDILILGFMAGAVLEMRKCLKDAGFKMYLVPMLVMLLLAYPVYYLMYHFVGGSFGIQGLVGVLLIAVMICLSIFTFRKKTGPTLNCETSNSADVGDTAEKVAAKSDLSSLFANVFILVYPALFLGIAWILSSKYSAIFAVCYAILIPIIGSDTFAFLFGVTIKGKKLCPSVSPKKTIAGAVGGVIGAILISVVFWAIFEYVGGLHSVFQTKCGYQPFISHSDGGWMWKSALIYVALGLVCGVLSELGDLAASSIKRAVGIKDYGKIFPGHGGFMDRIDSVMYCLVALLFAFGMIYGF